MATAKTKLIVKTVCATLITLAIAGALGGFAVLASGIYNVASTSQHLQFVHAILEKGMHHSVRFHARKVITPPLDDKQLVKSGAVLYQANCVECHGAPGVAPRGIGMGMQPVPGPLVDVTSKWDAGQMYWIVRHGIKMSGMPAWEYRMQDEELWQLVAFLQQMPQLSPADYKMLASNQEGEK
ncbi:MAG: cytochrome c [Herminiimonas sp.]|uniref:c-type cytochrome n=1 Tax=Herminiimonas sp. TaxID=1926289 RepID=UPI00271FC140|nr:cytochrome c [Herminiimonas sp.]MDO9420996.1 cytochrome c [Herminiimonas sp.]